MILRSPRKFTPKRNSNKETINTNLSTIHKHYGVLEKVVKAKAFCTFVLHVTG